MTVSRRILIVEDQKRERDALARLLNLEGYQTSTASSLAQLSDQDIHQIDLAICDLRLGVNNESGLEALTLIKRLKPDVPIIMVTAYGSIDSAVSAMKLGAIDYLTKPVKPAELLLLLNRYLPMNQRKGSKNQGNLLGIEKSLGHAAVMQQVYAQIADFSQIDGHIALAGEVGCGQDIVAFAIHEQSVRKNGPFVEVRVGNSSESSIALEFFGTDRKDYFSKTHTSKGKLALAINGTLYIDDARLIPPQTQRQICETIQQHRSPHDAQANVRLVVATYNHADQPSLAEGELISVCGEAIIRLPSLRDHREDIPALVDYFGTECSVQNLRSKPKFDERLIEFFCSYDWPGNIRQLRNTIENLIVLSRGDVISMQDLSVFWSGDAQSDGMIGFSSELSLSDLERMAVIGALKRSLGNKTHAAQKLGISVRTLQRKMKQWKLEGSDSEV